MEKYDVSKLTLADASALRSGMKADIVAKMEQLEADLYNYTQVLRVLGGTKAHGSGSVMKKVAALRTSIIQYC